jgi:hypothetical protein
MGHQALVAPDHPDTVERVWTHLFSAVEMSPPERPAFGPVLDRPQLAHLLNVAFWSSLHTEEGRTTRATLIHEWPPQSGDLHFAKERILDTGSVVKLAPLVGSGVLALGILTDGDTLKLWGITAPRRWSTQAHILDPATITVSRADKVFVYQLGRTDLLRSSVAQRSFEERVRFLWQASQPKDPSAFDNASFIPQLVSEMRRHRHGGLLLLVRAATPEWRSSVQSRSQHDFTTPYSYLRAAVEEGRAAYEELRAESLQGDLFAGRELRVRMAGNRMDRAIEAVSRFAAIDGALVLDSQLDVLAIGAIVTRRGKLPRHVQVADVAAGVHREVPVQSLGGTRHQSGAAFCAQTPESMAVVVSQDGSVTLLMREREQQDVQAVRHAEGGLLALSYH